jgi:hypothetical protein
LSVLSTQTLFIAAAQPYNQEFVKSMRKRRGIFIKWMILLFVAILAMPLLGWTSKPKSTTSRTIGYSQVSGMTVSRSGIVKASPDQNVKRGQDLFMGYAHFENDGPPCMGCHNVGSNGLLGGGAMGPDLTNVSTRLSPTELAATLANPGPVMKPIFSEHPLTAGEQADLIAFMNASSGQRETNREWVVIAISLAGFLAVIGLIQLLYRRRLRGVRKPLVEKARSGKS